MEKFYVSDSSKQKSIMIPVEPALDSSRVCPSFREEISACLPRFVDFVLTPESETTMIANVFRYLY